MLSSVPELSNLVLRVLFSKMRSSVTSKPEIMSHLLVSLRYTGIHLHWSGSGEGAEVVAVMDPVTSEVTAQVQSFKESPVTAANGLWGTEGGGVQGKKSM